LREMAPMAGAARAAFDLASSSARANTSCVELILSEPRWADLRPATYLQLLGPESIRALLLVDGQVPLVTARSNVPRQRLRSGRWELLVQTVDGVVPLGAHLQVDGDHIDLRRSGLVRDLAERARGQVKRVLARA